MIDGLLEIFIKKVFIDFDSVSKTMKLSFLFLNFLCIRTGVQSFWETICYSDTRPREYWNNISFIPLHVIPFHGPFDLFVALWTPYCQSPVKKWDFWRCWSRRWGHRAKYSTGRTRSHSNNGTRRRSARCSHHGTRRWYVRLRVWLSINDFGIVATCHGNCIVMYREVWWRLSQLSHSHLSSSVIMTSLSKKRYCNNKFWLRFWSMIVLKINYGL